MANKNLTERVSALGFPMLAPDEKQNANLTLADMVKSNDTRLWEGFPVVLVNSAEQGLFDYTEVKKHLTNQQDKTALEALLTLSLALYKLLNLNFCWTDKLNASFQKKTVFKQYLNKLKKDADVKAADKLMSSQRLKNAFNNYFNQTKTKLDKLLSVKEELNLEYALSQVFSPKQKELFFKKLRREKLTKTEREYFSRVVKNKVLALANPELHRLAQEIA